MSGEAEVTSFLLQTLKEAVAGYINLKSGAELEFQQLNDELLLLEAFIKDSTKRSEKKQVFREKERQIRELVYDVEDTIETFLTKKAAAEKKGFFSRQMEKLRIDMAQQVKSLRRKKIHPVLEDIKKEFGEIKVGDGGNPGTEVKKEQSVSLPPVTVFAQDQSVEWLKPDKFVDFEDQGTIIDYLMEPKKGLDVITITGMPGIGKTTLARRVFHDKNVVGEFPLRIWIHISQKFNSRDVFLDIFLKVLGTQATSNPSEEELIQALRGDLLVKKFLLVLDDIWTISDWKVIEKILPLNNREGKVLITSRDSEVARSASTGRIPHQMNKLGPDKSWELLKLIVFSRLDECPQQLEDVRDSIARKCGGSPLIIGVIGGILKDQYMKIRGIPAVRSEWMKVLGNVSDNLITGNDKSISEFVELSYSRLTDELRVCFLYTGLFPENHEIPASTLKQLWIAEGFIRPKDGEVTAHKLLHDLINKNLLMVENMRLDEVKSCWVHDAIREFCKAKAMEENFFTVVKESMEGVTEPQNSRRLCLHSNPSESIFEARRVRSFICFFKWDEKHITTITDAFNLLRVLSCKSIKFTEFPKVKKLILLKRITLSIDHLDILPKEIYNLLNLQTLIIETSSHSIKVKANLWEMMQLRRLKTKAAIFLQDDDKKPKVEAHKNLQVMSRLSPESCTPALSDRACNLKTLGIRGDLANLFATFSLEKFIHLKKLKLVNESTESPLKRLPQQGCFPPKLERLTLSKTKLDWNIHMPMLATINTLEVLKLKDEAFDGPSWDAMHVGFQNLQLLLLEESKLFMWKASATQFPSLRWLVLKKCRELQKIPSEVAQAENLEKLEVEYFWKSTADSAKAIKLNKLGVPLDLIIYGARK